jgi:hypothetical protein
MVSLKEESELQDMLRDLINKYHYDFPKLLGLNLMVVLKVYFRNRFNIDDFVKDQKEYMEKITI